MHEQIILGMDVGYSNLGFVSGPAGRPSGCCMPAGAGPANLLPHSMGGSNGQGVAVTTASGDKWVAGVEPHRFQQWSRDLHADYPASETYRALVHAALLRTQEKHIDHLVTGLPVSQYQDKSAQQRLIDQLAGTHLINGDTTVEVARVTVMPQPAGAYMDYINHAHDLDVVIQGRILIIDIGFYSVDWVTIEAGEIRMVSSGSSVNAMSMLLGAADQMLHEQLGAKPGVERLERTIRDGHDEILIAGKKVALKAVLDEASRHIAGRAMTELRQSMRADTSAIDLLLLVGGGARYYESAAREIFGYAGVQTLAEPVMANPRGFWQAGFLG